MGITGAIVAGVAANELIVKPQQQAKRAAKDQMKQQALEQSRLARREKERENSQKNIDIRNQQREVQKAQAAAAQGRQSTILGGAPLAAPAGGAQVPGQKTVLGV